MRATGKMNFVKGVGMGLAVGAAAGMLLKPQKKSKRIVSDAVKAFGDVAETVMDAMGW